MEIAIAIIVLIFGVWMLRQVYETIAEIMGKKPQHVTLAELFDGAAAGSRRIRRPRRAQRRRRR